MLPRALVDVVEALAVLPGVGERTAERYAYFLLKSDPEVTEKLYKVLADLHSGVKRCPVTFALMGEGDEVSPYYGDAGRDKTTVLVVEEPLDVYALEKTRGYTGTYHVLGGALSPIDGVTPDKLHIAELLRRVESDGVQEVIIATNPSVEGESTAIMLTKMLREKYPELTVTRLARGLPLGVSLEYADQITLAAALDGRTNL